MTTPYIITQDALTTINLGKVLTEENQIINKISNFAFPTQATAATLSINIFGKLRNITLSGVYTGTESELNIWVTSIEDWINDGIQSSRIYHDSIGNSYYVMCIDFNWTRDTVSPGRIIYSFVFLESGTT